MIDQELSLTDRRRQAVRLDIAAAPGGRLQKPRVARPSGQHQPRDRRTYSARKKKYPRKITISAHIAGW
ncbi:hypothetical protein, partial [Nocardia cyriacigeorgica]|uniref:hypothetical protein n=1 Tax=Nocardia cyriacigeorgica TaxID=135487 RepID=UPI002453F904